MPVTIIRRRKAAVDLEPVVAMPPKPFDIANLADVLERLPMTDLPERAHRDVRWAINTFCTGLGVAPIDVPADARSIRDRLDSLSPAMLGFRSVAAFSNMRSILRRVLRLMGKTARRRARNEPLSAPYAALYERLKTRTAKAGVGAFLSYLSAEKHDLADVGDQHVDRFAHVLEEGSLQGAWRKSVDTTVREWNKASKTVVGWPSTELHTPWGKREVTTRPMEDLPPPYQGSIEDYLHHLENPPIDDDYAPVRGLRPETIISKRFALRYMGSVLLRAGMPPEKLTSVDDLVTKEALDTILGFFEPDKDGTGRVTCLQMAMHLKSIATSQQSPCPEAIHRLKHTIWRHKRKTRGLTKRNREKVARLSDDRTASLLVTLPPRIFAALGKIAKPTKRDANLALTALYIELGLMWPARIANLSKIHLQNNIIRTGKGRTTRVILHFDAGVVKNNKDLEAELPPSAVHMLDLFIQRYRPLLIQTPSSYLFPHRDGGARHRGTIWGSVTKLTRQHVGVSVNPHLFRHVGVHFFLKAHPGNYEVARRALGHSSIDTTTQHYAGAEDNAAIRMFDENVLRLREAAPEALARGRRGRTRPAAAPRKPDARKHPAATPSSISTKRGGTK
jgi:integrase